MIALIGCLFFVTTPTIVNALDKIPPGTVSASFNSGKIRPTFDGTAVAVLTPTPGKHVMRVTDLIVTNNTSLGCQVYFVVADSSGANVYTTPEVVEVVAKPVETEHLSLISGPVIEPGKTLWAFVQSSSATPCPNSNPNYYDLFVYARGYYQ